MARAKTAEPAPEPPKLKKCCGTCKGWSSFNNTPFFGECGPSRAGGPAARVTTDLTSCSAHEWRQ